MSKTLAQKMIGIMSRVESVEKLATVQMTASRSYKAVTHDDVAALLHNELVREGVWVKVTQDSCEVEINNRKNRDGQDVQEFVARVWVVVTFVNADNPSDKEDCRSFAYAIDSGDKAVGKAVSMAVKYVLLKNFTLESVDEEESRPDVGYQHTPKPQRNDYAGGEPLTQKRHWDELAALAKQKGQARAPFAKTIKDYEAAKASLLALPDAK